MVQPNCFTSRHRPGAVEGPYRFQDRSVAIVSQKSFVPHHPVRRWDKTFLDSYIAAIFKRQQPVKGAELTKLAPVHRDLELCSWIGVTNLLTLLVSMHLCTLRSFPRWQQTRRRFVPIMEGHRWRSWVPSKGVSYVFSSLDEDNLLELRIEPLEVGSGRCIPSQELQVLRRHADRNYRYCPAL